MRFLAALFCATLVYAQPFKLEKSISLGAIDGRIDHLAIDLKTQRVLLSALGNNSVEVVDIAAGKVVHSFGGMNEPQGTGYVPATNRFYVANGKDGKLRSYDAASYKPAGEMGFGDDADNIRYDAARKQLWVGYADGALASIDVTTGKRTGPDIYLDGHPESFQLEKNGPRIFINIPDARELEVVDRMQRRILAKWPMTVAGANFPMTLDEATHRVFIACRKPAKLMALDMDSGKITAQYDCPGDSDDIFFDASRKRIYVAGGAGFLEAFEQKGADEYRSLGKIATAAGARTALFVPDLSRIFLAVPHRDNQAPEVRVYSVQ